MIEYTICSFTKDTSMLVGIGIHRTHQVKGDSGKASTKNQLHQLSFVLNDGIN